MTEKRDAGFTLIETLVALTVFALVAGALHLCLATGWKGVHAARLEEAAVALARSELAAAVDGAALAEGMIEQTTAAGFTWRREVSAYAGPGSDIHEPGASQAYRVSVSVRWQDGPLRPERTITLETIKIGAGG